MFYRCYQQTCRLDVRSVASSTAKMQLFVNLRYSKSDFLHFAVYLGEGVKEKTLQLRHSE